ncbi:CTP synthase [Dictyocoela muelleri]|nr:CTP synthase [Dictyocoela muelleri]
MPIINNNKDEVMRLGKQSVIIKKNTKVEQIYGSNLICERFRHRYGLNQQLSDIFEKNGFICAGKCVEGERIDILELKDHLFFIGVQFHPELLANPRHPHPLFSELIDKSFDRVIHKN